MKRLSRSDFLKASAMGMGAVAISTGLAGCVLDSNDKREILFSRGVASGDPLQDGVILWTRAPAAEKSGGARRRYPMQRPLSASCRTIQAAGSKCRCSHSLMSSDSYSH